MNESLIKFRLNNQISIHLTVEVNYRFLMGITRSLKVKEDYLYYKKLLSERKSIFSEVIEINEVGNNANTLEFEEVVKQEIMGAKMLFIVNVKCSNYKFFQFKIRAKEYIPYPFFRFDSDGDTHRNRVDGITLVENAVTTPHFHKFNEKGTEIAYKTDKLLNEKEAKALEDINLCVAHFFHEANLRVKENSFPQVKISSNSLGIDFSKTDPNENIVF
ncbi:hypothetical protein C8N41_1077 [Winogradskyella sediminis]|nr:hypothetical protein C8N41_1077 [Winogradskyella sediminis]